MVALGVVGALTFAAVNVLYDSNYDYPQYHRPGPLGVVLAVLAVVPVLAVRRYPWPVLAIVSAAVLTSTAIGYSRWVAAMGLALAAGMVLADGPRMRAVVPVGAGILVWIALRHEPGVEGAVQAAAVYTVTASIVGLAIRLGHRRLAATPSSTASTREAR